VCLRRMLEIGKSTLHCLREKARQHQPRAFRVYSKVRKKLMPYSSFSRVDRNSHNKGSKGRRS